MGVESKLEDSRHWYIGSTFRRGMLQERENGDTHFIVEAKSRKDQKKKKKKDSSFEKWQRYLSGRICSASDSFRGTFKRNLYYPPIRSYEILFHKGKHMDFKFNFQFYPIPSKNDGTIPWEYRQIKDFKVRA